MKKRARGIKETEETVERFLGEILKPHAPRIIGLSGNLGAGKTAFVKAIGKKAGVKDTVSSPTFVLLRLYRISPRSVLGKRFSRLAHIDAYRIKPEELHVLGWDELVRDTKTLLVVEWPEMIQKKMPKDARIVRMEIVDEETRDITW